MRSKADMSELNLRTECRENGLLLKSSDVLFRLLVVIGVHAEMDMGWVHPWVGLGLCVTIVGWVWSIS